MAKLLSIFYFFYFAVVGVYVIFIPKILATVGYSGVEIGILFAASPLIRFLIPFAFMQGFRLDNRVVRIALGILFISTIAFYLSVHHFYTLLLSNIGMGIGLGLILPYMEVVALHHLGKERYGRVRLFGSIGFILIALAVVKIMDTELRALDFLLLLVFATLFISFKIANRVEDTKEQNKANLFESASVFLHDYKLWIALTLMQVSFGAFYNFFTIATTAHGIALDVTIYLWSFGVVCEIVMLYFQARILGFNLLYILEFTMLITAIRWFLLFVFPSEVSVLFFTQSLHAFSFALFHTAAISYLHQLYRDKTLAQQLFAGVTYGLGGLLGALGSGYIYEFATDALFLSASVVACVGLLSLAAWHRDPRAQRIS